MGSIDLSETRESGGLFVGSLVPGVATTATDVPGNVASLQVRTVIGSNRLNEFSYQMSGNEIGTTTPDGTRNTRDQYGTAIPELFAENAANRIPVISFTAGGLSTIGANQFFTIQYRNHTFTDNFTWSRGSHNFKGACCSPSSRRTRTPRTRRTGGSSTPRAAAGRRSRTS